MSICDQEHPFEMTPEMLKECEELRATRARVAELEEQLADAQADAEAWKLTWRVVSRLRADLAEIQQRGGPV